MNDAKRKKILIGTILLSILVILGYFIFVFFADEGHRKLSGNGDKVFIKQSEADDTFQEVLTALGLGDRRTSATSKRPYYAFGFETSFLSSSRWWTLERGFIKDTYSSITLDKTESDRVNTDLKNQGWNIGIINGQTSFSLSEDFESARITKEKKVKKEQETANYASCKRLISCQETVKYKIYELINSPLSVSYTHTKSPYILYATYTANKALDKVEIELSLYYSCTTENYCGGT